MKFNSSEINSSNCWQVGTGNDTRSYLDIFLKYGVALVGPGNPGREGEPATEIYYKTHPGVTNWGAVLNKAKIGEYIIAKKGTSLILAIGKVIATIDHSELFSDVEGWDLQHFIKVKWYIPKNSDKRIQFDNYVLGQSTMSGCNKKIVYEEIYKQEFEEYKSLSKIEDKEIPKKIDFPDIMNMLIDRGLRVQDSENISNTIKRIIQLTRWYRQNDKDVLESEIISFLVLPLLIALGWSEQKIKLEYQNIDVALFEESFKGDYASTPYFIIEAKSFSNGLAFTEKQIISYANKYPDCKRFIATNGFRYKIFFKEKNILVQKGYFNLLKLYERNVLYDIPLTSIESIFEISNLH